jgi:hypothetical protein
MGQQAHEDALRLLMAPATLPAPPPSIEGSCVSALVPVDIPGGCIKVGGPSDGEPGSPAAAPVNGLEGGGKSLPGSQSKQTGRNSPIKAAPATPKSRRVGLRSSKRKRGVANRPAPEAENDQATGSSGDLLMSTGTPGYILCALNDRDQPTSSSEAPGASSGTAQCFCDGGPMTTGALDSVSGAILPYVAREAAAGGSQAKTPSKSHSTNDSRPKPSGQQKRRRHRRKKGSEGANGALEAEFALALLTNESVRSIAEHLAAARVDLPAVDVEEARAILQSQVSCLSNSSNSSVLFDCCLPVQS